MFKRHDLAWLTDAGWRASRDSVAPKYHPALERWQRSGWPAVVRRTDPDAMPNQVCLGIALPPDSVTRQKIRISLRAPISETSRTMPPLAIDAIIATAPAPWRHQLQLLAGQAVQRGLVFKVYGSIAWQALTAVSYVTASSDIDMLFSPTTRTQLEDGLALLEHHAGILPLDGETLFPSGQAVAWKEWVQAIRCGINSRVLVKENSSVHLTTTSALLASLGNIEAISCAG
ncbi:malonate decarboxylase holo-[acyl-carrier-protein] synthase [Paralcaligenes ginsengisoli]